MPMDLSMDLNLDLNMYLSIDYAAMTYSVSGMVVEKGI